MRPRKPSSNIPPHLKHCEKWTTVLRLLATAASVVYKLAHRQTDRQTDKQTDRQTDRGTNRQTDGQTDRQTDETYHYNPVVLRGR